MKHDYERRQNQKNEMYEIRGQITKSEINICDKCASVPLCQEI